MTSSERGAPGLVARAKRYATQAHRRIDHRRKYTGHSYESHLKSVAALVAEVTDDDETIAAAWLHDVVEDTPATVQQIEGEFGAAVAALVADLTDVSKPGDGNRATRKAIDRQHTARATPRAKTVKLADLIDNCQDIARHDPRFDRVFLEEMRALLEILGEGDAELLRRARRLHARSSERLEVGMLQTAAPKPMASLDQSQQHVSRLFLETFTARDIARPLLSFDAERESTTAMDRRSRTHLTIGLSWLGEGAQDANTPHGDGTHANKRIDFQEFPQGGRYPCPVAPHGRRLRTGILRHR